jgi:trehalose 6-phosphate synthase/phosphatase
VEVKTASIAWHYRSASRDFGARQAHELRMWLGDVLSNQPLEVREGKRVIDVRLRGGGKASVGRRIEAETPPGTTIVAIGHDGTTEELFRALAPSSVTVAVGRRDSGAAFVTADYRAVRALLRALVADRAAITARAVHLFGEPAACGDGTYGSAPAPAR